MADVDVGEVEFADAGAGRFEHGRAGIDGDYFFDVGGEEGKHGPGARADVGDDPVGVEEEEEAFEVEGIAEPFSAELIPLRGVFAEEGIGARCGFAFSEDGGKAMRVGSGKGIVIEVGAGEGA